LTLPNLLIEESLVVDGQRRVEILSYGGGHTDSDVFVWIPGDRLVVTGDLCFQRHHPRLVDGHPGAWAKILTKILGLGPQTVMPGHGEPGDEGLLEMLVPYFEEAESRLADYEDDWADVPLPRGTEDWDWDYHYRQGLAAIASR
jgi:glyoxylase-like metal-dependent hydrolase (beta-lactamase superfamily II)